MAQRTRRFTFDEFLGNIPIIYDLIKGFLDLQIYDQNNERFFKWQCVPPIGEITNVIYHVFYKHVFDRVIAKMYPGITYTRWGHQVFLAIKEGESFLLQDIDIRNLLERISRI